MPNTTSPDDIIYPISTDPIAPLNAVFQDLAESTQSALDVIRVEIADANSSQMETAERVGAYTLTLDDRGMVVQMNADAPVNVTVPTNAAVPFPIGSLVYVYNRSSDEITIAGDSGVTVRNATTVAQFKQVLLRKRATNEWVLV